MSKPRHLTQTTPEHLQYNARMHHQSISWSATREWLIANSSGEFLYQWNKNMIWFENEQDLIFFTLRWKNNDLG